MRIEAGPLVNKYLDAIAAPYMRLAELQAGEREQLEEGQPRQENGTTV